MAPLNTLLSNSTPNPPLTVFISMSCFLQCIYACSTVLSLVLPTKEGDAFNLCCITLPLNLLFSNTSPAPLEQIIYNNVSTCYSRPTAAPSLCCWDFFSPCSCIPLGFMSRFPGTPGFCVGPPITVNLLVLELNINTPLFLRSFLSSILLIFQLFSVGISPVYACIASIVEYPSTITLYYIYFSCSSLKKHPSSIYARHVYNITKIC